MSDSSINENLKLEYAGQNATKFAETHRLQSLRHAAMDATIRKLILLARKERTSYCVPITAGDETTDFSCLDVGCGTGHYTRLMQDTLPDADVYGVDLVQSMIGVAHEEGVDRNSGNKPSYYCGDICSKVNSWVPSANTSKKPLSDKTRFDLVLSAFCLCHFRSKESILKAIIAMCNLLCDEDERGVSTLLLLCPTMPSSEMMNTKFRKYGVHYPDMVFGEQSPTSDDAPGNVDVPRATGEGDPINVDLYLKLQHCKTPEEHSSTTNATSETLRLHDYYWNHNTYYELLRKAGFDFNPFVPAIGHLPSDVRENFEQLYGKEYVSDFFQNKTFYCIVAHKRDTTLPKSNLLSALNAKSSNYTTVRASLDIAHCLDSSRLTAEENCQVYGKCNRKGGHGHCWIVSVTTHSDYINEQALAECVKEAIEDNFDHRNLNEQYSCPHMRGVVPTVENFAYVVGTLLKQSFMKRKLDYYALKRIRVFETRTGSTTWDLTPADILNLRVGNHEVILNRMPLTPTMSITKRVDIWREKNSVVPDVGSARLWRREGPGVGTSYNACFFDITFKGTLDTHKGMVENLCTAKDVILAALKDWRSTKLMKPESKLFLEISTADMREIFIKCKAQMQLQGVWPILLSEIHWEHQTTKEKGQGAQTDLVCAGNESPSEMVVQIRGLTYPPPISNAQ